MVDHSWGTMLLAAHLGYAPEKIDQAVLAEPGFLDQKEYQEWMDYQSKFYKSLDYLWFALKTGFESEHIKGPADHAAEDYLYKQVVCFFANHPDNPYHCPGEAYDAPIWRFGALAYKTAR